jgi:hypothetical protein
VGRLRAVGDRLLGTGGAAVAERGDKEAADLVWWRPERRYLCGAVDKHELLRKVGRRAAAVA